MNTVFPAPGSPLGKVNAHPLGTFGVAGAPAAQPMQTSASKTAIRHVAIVIVGCVFIGIPPSLEDGNENRTKRAMKDKGIQNRHAR
jgi:hypothetical protein